MASIAQPTRSARSGSIANSRAEATVNRGRSRLPPPMAAWRIASYRRWRPSPGTASSRQRNRRPRARPATLQPRANRRPVDRLSRHRRASAPAACRRRRRQSARSAPARPSAAPRNAASAGRLPGKARSTGRAALRPSRACGHLLEPRKRSFEAQLADVISAVAMDASLTLAGGQIKSLDYSTRVFLNGSRMPGRSRRSALVAFPGKRCFRLASVTLALAREAPRSTLHGRLSKRVSVGAGAPAALAALATAASSSRCVGEAQRHRILRLDVRHVPMAAVADRGDRRVRRADQLADLSIADFGMVLDDPGDAVRAVLTLPDRRVARALGAADLPRAP